MGNWMTWGYSIDHTWFEEFHPASVSPLPVSVRYRHFKYRCTMHYLGKTFFISLLQEWKQQRRKLVFRFFFRLIANVNRRNGAKLRKLLL